MAYNPLRRSYTKWIRFPFPVMLGLNTTAPKDLTGYQSPDLVNVRHMILGQLNSGEAVPSIKTRTGLGVYSHGRTAGKNAQIKGGYGYVYKNSSNVLTYRNIVQANNGIYYSVPLSSTIIDEDRFSKPESTTSMGLTAYGNLWTYYDDLNGSNPWGISGSLAYSTTVAGGVGYEAAFDAGVSDCTVSCIINNYGAAGQYPGFVLRLQDYNNHIKLYADKSDSKLKLYVYSNGSSTSLGSSAALTFTAGDIISVTMLSNVYTIKQNGTTVLTVTDASNSFVARTYHGIRQQSSTTNLARFSDFRVQSVSPEWIALNSALTTTATDYPSFETFNNYCVISNGADNMKQWDGTESATALVDVVASGWVTKTSMALAREKQTSFILGDMAYITNGRNTSPSITYSKYTDIYDSIADVWTTGIPNGLSVNYSFGTEIGGYGYSAHGMVSGTTPTNSIERYSPLENVWTVKTAGGTARGDGVSFAIMGRMYVAGGYTDATTVTKKTDYYEPFSDTWTNVADMPVATGLTTGNTSNGGNGQWAFGNDGSVGVKKTYWFSGIAWTTLTDSNTAGVNPYCGTAFNGVSYWKGQDYESFNRVTNAWTALTNDSLAIIDGAFFQVNGKLYMAGGSPIATGVTTNSLIMYNANNQPPQAMYLKSHKGYLFGARTPTYQNRVWFSMTGDHSIWDVDSFMDVNKDDGGWVTGLETFANGNFLVAFKSTGIYAIDGTVFDPDPTIGNQSVRMINDKGCIAPKSIVKVNNNLIIYFGTDGKFYEFDGVNSTPISECIHSTILSYDGATFQYSKSIFFPKYNEYWMSIRTIDRRVILVYNVVTKQWFKFTNQQGQVDSLFIVRDSTTNLPVVLGGTVNTGFIIRFDSDKWGQEYTADLETAPISAYYKTSWTGLGNNLWKLIRRMYCYCTQPLTGNLLVDVYSNFSGTAGQTQQSPAMTHTDQRNRVDLNSTGHRFQFKFSNSTLNQSFEIQSFDIYWRPKGGGLWGQTL